VISSFCHVLLRFVIKNSDKFIIFCPFFVSNGKIRLILLEIDRSKRFWRDGDRQVITV